MLKNLKKKSEGFTIIEVLIVLAIAGLIMLIVFLAVPALQRNQRNNARNNDGARVAAAVTECLSNRNGVTNATGCGDVTNIQPGALSQLTTVAVVTADTFTQTEANVRFNRRCNPAGSASIGGTANRQFVVMYQLEGGVNRCIASE